MLAIYKKELRSYLFGMMGCVIAVVMLAIAGFFIVNVNVNSASAHFEYSTYFLVDYFVLVITIPFITMRSIAEERRSKTEQLLFSLPVSVYKIVLAKYFASLTVVAAPLAVCAVYPLILKLFDTAGVMSLAAAYNALLMVALLAAAMTAIGVFASSLVENQIIAALITVAIFLLLYFMSSIAAAFPTSATASMVTLVAASAVLGGIVLAATRNSTAACIATGVPAALCIALFIYDRTLFAGLAPDILYSIDFFALCSSSTIYGVFDLRAVVYYVTVAALFVFVTVQMMQRRRYN